MKEHLFDKRVVQRALQEGLVDNEVYQRMLEALPDVSHKLQAAGSSDDARDSHSLRDNTLGGGFSARRAQDDQDDQDDLDDDLDDEDDDEDDEDEDSDEDDEAQDATQAAPASQANVPRADDSYADVSADGEPSDDDDDDDDDEPTPAEL